MKTEDKKPADVTFSLEGAIRYLENHPCAKMAYEKDYELEAAVKKVISELKGLH